MRDLYEILSVGRAYIDFALPFGIVTYYDISYTVIDTVRDNFSGRYTHCVFYSGIAFPEIVILTLCETFYLLFILDTLKPCVFFVVQAIV